VIGRAGSGLALGSLILWNGVAGAAAPESFSGLVKKVAPAVVNVLATHEVEQQGADTPEMPFTFPKGSPFEKFFKDFRDRQRQDPGGRRPVGALGSGFVIDPTGYIVTNNHVVDEATDVKIRLDDESIYPARVVGVDPQTDIALLKVDAGHELPAVALGDSDAVEVGDWVVAVGNPFGLGGTVTSGIVSARGRNINSGPYVDFLQIDAPINQGNSGGPLFNMDGKVVGVNAAIFSPNGGSVGIGFAIPSNIVRAVVDQLRTVGKVERGWMGVRVQSLTPDLASAMGVPEGNGALVSEVTGGSPADKAGIRQGDVIVRFGGKPVGDPRELARLVAGHATGESTSVRVWRDGAEAELSIVTERQPATVASATGAVPSANVHSAALGAELAALTPERRDQFDIAPAVSGVLVLDVKGADAFEQGLRAGDVIRRVGNQVVTGPEEVESVIHAISRSGGKSLLLLVNRRGADIFLGIRLGIA
jgi:serine protease Do